MLIVRSQNNTSKSYIFSFRRGFQNMQNDQLLTYYTSTNEAGRLTRIESELEMLRTRDILKRHLPQSPAVILDVGGVPPIHSFWLAPQHYEVHLLDIVPSHID